MSKREESMSIGIAGVICMGVALGMALLGVGGVAPVVLALIGHSMVGEYTLLGSR